MVVAREVKEKLAWEVDLARLALTDERRAMGEALEGEMVAALAGEAAAQRPC